MKTIEIMSGEQKAQFTTKSVTFGGKEYLYIKMSDVSHNTDDCVYTFTYENEIKTLPYEAKDTPVLNAIFSQVQSMQAKKKASAEPHSTSGQTASAAAAEKETSNSAADSPVESDIPSEEETPVDPKAEKKEEKARLKEEKERLKAEKKAEKQKEKERRKAEKAQKKASSSTEEPQPVDSDNVESAEKDESTEGSEKFVLFKDSENENDQLSSESDDSDTVSENADVNDQEKKTRFKKSIIIFGIIVAVIAVLSLVYFLIFGTKDKPSSINPSSTNSESYEDIDELINDLQ